MLSRRQYSLAAWSHLNADELVSYFTEDGGYHNMPAQPVKGRANLRKFIGGFLTNWAKTEWDTVNLLAQRDYLDMATFKRALA